MRIKKSDKIGTIHELPILLANMEEIYKIKPIGTKQKNQYFKIFEKYKLFSKNLSLEEKNKIIIDLKLINFEEYEINEQKLILKSINSFNRLINKKRIEIEDEIKIGLNVKENVLFLSNKLQFELTIPKQIRIVLKIKEKKILLKKINSKITKNRIKFYSGQSYNFLIKNGFSNNYFMSYDESQKIRKNNNIIEYLLNKMLFSINEIYELDKIKYIKSEPKKWKLKQKIFDKLFKVLEHNISISVNKKYNKSLLNKDKNNKLIKNNGEYPILLKILGEIIEIYIP